VVVVENEAGLVDVEGLGAVDVADRHTHEFKSEIHDSTVWGGTDGVCTLSTSSKETVPLVCSLPVLAELLWKPGSMTAGPRLKIFSWTVVVPILATVLLALTWGREIGVLLQVLVAFALAGAVLSAVNHAEVVAHRVGEPFGSLVLAVAVTVIEVGLIVTLMVGGGPGSASLARDTVFAAVMITCNGIVGIALLIGAVRYHITIFNAEGTGAALATVTTLAIELGISDLHYQSSRAGIHSCTADVCSNCLAGALRDIRCHTDGSAPRLLPPDDFRRGGR
jgi:hypothetical protein